jgi:quercetin dioxygenase-like cupin family protein
VTALFVAGDRVAVLIAAEHSGGTVALVDVTVPPGGGPPLPVHSREDEAFHVLAGEITFRLVEATVAARRAMRRGQGCDPALSFARRCP